MTMPLSILPLRHCGVMWLILLCGTLWSMETDSVVKKLDPVAYQRAIAATEEPRIVDVRTDLEFADGHLPGAVRIGIEDEDFEKRLKALGLDQPLYLYCGSGFRSAKSAKRAAEFGFKKVLDLEGGIKAWKDAGLPVESE